MPAVDLEGPLPCEIEVSTANEGGVEEGDEEAPSKAVADLIAGDNADLHESNQSSPAQLEPSPAQTGPAPSDVERLRTMLRVFVADLQTWHAHPCLDHRPSQATQQPPHDLAAEREIRSRATQMALFAIAIVARSTWAADESQLFYAHVASFRPWKVNQDWVAGSLVPAVCRVFFGSQPVQIALPLLCVFGIACGFSVLFDRFEAGSAQEGIACFAVSLTFPSIVCIVASLSAKSVRRLLKEFETLYVLAVVLGMVCMQLALFRDHPAKLGCVVLSLPSWLMSGFMDAYIEGGRVLTSRVFLPRASSSA